MHSSPRPLVQVVAIHCKAGKGRTGCIIACLLVFLGVCSSADDALLYFARQRTHNSKGVTIPSQIRSVLRFSDHTSHHPDRHTPPSSFHPIPYPSPPTPPHPISPHSTPSHSNAPHPVAHPDVSNYNTSTPPLPHPIHTPPRPTPPKPTLPLPPHPPTLHP